MPKGWSLTIRARDLSRIVLALMLLAGQRPLFAESPGVWILVDTGQMTLSVMEGESVRRAYANIAVGRGGVTPDKRNGDDKTPLGEFHIVRIATDTPFRRFFALDYPSLPHAERALQNELISARQYAAIRQALRSHRVPPQDTALGGYIGIHGIGRGDTRIHEKFNWTNGCVALTNEQIDDLNQWIRLGMRVIVR
jgi:murein L,D-transpeptidase YafK